jgi:hypothetical protein
MHTPAHSALSTMAMDWGSINCWSLPRCASTSLMYAFCMRADTAVLDEPLYASYLHRTRAERPYKDQARRDRRIWPMIWPMIWPICEPGLSSPGGADAGLRALTALMGAATAPGACTSALARSCKTRCQCLGTRKSWPPCGDRWPEPITRPPARPPGHHWHHISGLHQPPGLPGRQPPCVRQENAP